MSRSTGKLQKTISACELQKKLLLWIIFDYEPGQMFQKTWSIRQRSWQKEPHCVRGSIRSIGVPWRLIEFEAPIAKQKVARVAVVHVPQVHTAPCDVLGAGKQYRLTPFPAPGASLPTIVMAHLDGKHVDPPEHVRMASGECDWRVRQSISRMRLSRQNVHVHTHPTTCHSLNSLRTHTQTRTHIHTTMLTLALPVHSDYGALHGTLHGTLQ